MKLFSARGFEGTTVGELEKAAGFAPRSGALYQYFASKHALLEAAVTRAFEQNRELRRVAAMLPLEDATSELQVLVRWLLAALRDAEFITRIFEKDGDAVPALRARFANEVTEPGYASAGEVVGRLLGDEADAQAIGAVLLGAIVSYRRYEWTFGRSPLGIDEDRFVAAWVAIAKAILVDSRDTSEE